MAEQPRPDPPTFSTLEQERTYRKQHLAAAFRVIGHLGLSEGTAGHLTARDPERTDHFWVNPYGRHFSMMRVSDLLLVNDHGEVVEGNRVVNLAAFAIHSAIHAGRPDVVAAAHSHSMYGKTWSAFGQLLDPITQDSCAFYEDHTVFDEFGGLVLEVEDSKRLSHALGDHKAIFLRNHGHLTVGRTVDEAAWWYISLERAAQSQLLAQAAGKPLTIDREMAELTRAQIGTPKAGWFSFQPLFEQIVEAEPELLE